jgi:hypothetical protein
MNTTRTISADAVRIARITVWSAELVQFVIDELTDVGISAEQTERLLMALAPAYIPGMGQIGQTIEFIKE